MAYKEHNKRIVVDLLYKACRKADMRGPKRDDCNVFVGYNPLIGTHIIAVHPSPNAPALIKRMGADGITNKEELIDAVMLILDGTNCNLIVYPEPGYSRPS